MKTAHPIYILSQKLCVCVCVCACVCACVRVRVRGVCACCVCKESKIIKGGGKKKMRDDGLSIINSKIRCYNLEATNVGKKRFKREEECIK